jgi:hypothetical protein
MPRALGAGGKDALLRVAETTAGLTAVAAAAALMRAEAGEVTALGAEHLARFIATGSQQERRLAIRMSDPGRPEHRLAVVAATKDPDPEVSLMASARLATDPKLGERARRALRKLAKQKGSLAVQARAALAAVRDESVVPSLVELLTARDAGTRTVAARALVRMGRLSAAATALADDRPDVRTEIACLIVARSENQPAE